MRRRCCCPSDHLPCDVTICVIGCTSPNKLNGAVVTIKTGGGIIVATCTTDSSGCCTLTIPAAGTYTILITRTGFNNFTTIQAITCGSTHTYTLVPADGYFCAGLCACPNTSPETVTINDGFGDVTCTTGTIFGTWGGCAMRPATGYFLQNDCTFWPDGTAHLLTQDIPIWFGVFCTVDGGIAVSVNVVECFTFGFRYNYCDNCDCSNPTSDFGLTLDCSGVGASSSSSFSCDPFSGSYTLTCPGPASTDGNLPKMFDVYGGTASFSLTP